MFSLSRRAHRTVANVTAVNTMAISNRSTATEAPIAPVAQMPAGLVLVFPIPRQRQGQDVGDHHADEVVEDELSVDVEQRGSAGSWSSDRGVSTRCQVRQPLSTQAWIVDLPASQPLGIGSRCPGTDDATFWNRSQETPSPEVPMFGLALALFLVAIVAAIFGFGGIAVAAAGIAKIVFFIAVVLLVITLVSRAFRGGPIT